MKGKLIKNSAGEYYLIVDKCPDFVSISEPITNGFVIASVHNDDIDFLKLSLKNCQAIERGYDLDELVEKLYSRIIADDKYSFERGLKIGFQKCLEILGDRKFTEEDVRLAYNQHGDILQKSNNYDSFIQSIQQNEWDVEIITEPLQGEINGGTWVVGGSERPKLDADGCLILKRTQT